MIKSRANFCCWLIGCVFLLCTSASANDAVDVCSLLKGEKKSVVYLLDEQGKVSNGPVDFGIYKYSYRESDVVSIPTKYRVLIYPSRIRAYEGMDMQDGVFGVALIKTKNLCPNSKTYNVVYQIREASKKGEWTLPWQEQGDFYLPYLSDPLGFSGEASLIYKFDTKIIGKLVDGELK